MSGSPCVFLSASVPSGERAAAYPASDAREISDAVLAIVRAVLAAGWRLVFGGHPMITPYVFLAAGEQGVKQEHPARVVVYQSEVFTDDVTPETRDLERLGYGRIRWVPAHSGERPGRSPQSLASLRDVMLRETKPIGGFFVGGMQGVVVEYELTLRLLDNFLAFPVKYPGGAASTLPLDGRTPETLAEALMSSNRYPAVANRAVAVLRGGHAL